MIKKNLKIVIDNTARETWKETNQTRTEQNTEAGSKIQKYFSAL